MSAEDQTSKDFSDLGGSLLADNVRYGRDVDALEQKAAKLRKLIAENAENAQLLLSIAAERRVTELDLERDNEFRRVAVAALRGALDSVKSPQTSEQTDQTNSTEE